MFTMYKMYLITPLSFMEHMASKRNPDLENLSA